MVPFDETPEDEEDDDLPAPDLSAIFGGAGDDDDDDPVADKLATDSLDALRDEELTGPPGASVDTPIDPAKAAIIEATGEDDEDDDIEDLEELERDGFGRERDFGFDSIDEEEEEEDDDY
ncbi:MAG: hypothetical protein Q7T55_21090 [Solirubrobacteraceae bacterium]|nr:hypothetical protein [Solirubrobacteraceae bacterium]